MRRHAKAATAGSNLRRTGAARLVFLCVPALLLAALFAASAQAAPETVAEFGEGAGQVDFPLSIAVDQSNGDFYVADSNNGRILKLDAAGDFRLAWGYGVRDGQTLSPQTCGPDAIPPTTRCFKGEGALSATGPGAVNPEAVAVDQASGDVYVTDAPSRRVSKFTSSGQFVYMVGKNVNKTKEVEGGATQAEKNICTAASGDACGEGETGTGLNEFSELRAIAVDSSGVVWVGDTNRLVSFSSSGAAGSEIALPGAGNTGSLALDSSGNFYVKSASLAGIRKLEAGTGTLLSTFDAAGSASAVALDLAGNVYVGDSTSPYRFKVYNPAGEQTAQFGAGQVIGKPGDGFFGGNAIAIGESAGKLYAAGSATSEAESVVQAFPLPEPGPLPENQHVTNLEPTTVTLAAELNPEGDTTTYHFEYGLTESYGQSTPTKTLPGAAFDSEAVQEALSGLTPDTTYHFRLVATNHCKPAEPSVECTVTGPDTTFTTRPAVGIDAQWATDITATSAILHAELDPIGVAASWWIEYGTTASYGQSTAESVLPASFGDLSVATPFINLTPGTTYHYRFAARDERDGNVYVVHGEDKTFTTQVSGLGLDLADGRAWEMVTPPDKFGALLRPTNEGHVQAAADGNSLAYLAFGSIEPTPEGNRVVESSSTLARRSGTGDWHSKDITPPHGTVVPLTIGNGFEYKLFSSNLERAVFEQRDMAPLSPEASERTPYLRQNTEPAALTPLVTGKEGFTNVPPGTVFGGDPGQPLGDVSIAGATPDLSHVVVESKVPLIVGAANNGLYEWESGQLRQVSVLPADEGGAAVGGTLGSGSASVRKAISDDGSRAFWSRSSPNALYLRDMEREETVRLDVLQPGAVDVGGANPVFQGANAEGTVAFFTDSHQLTEDANEKGRDLYRCEVTVEEGELACELSDLTTDTAGAKEAAEVQGLVSGMGDDATHVYFVAKGVLDPQPNGMGASALSGQPNLYLWQEGDGIRFIARLSEEDAKDWAVTGPSSSLSAFTVTASSSPSGRYLAFMSQRSLTGYDNRDAKTGELDQEVFRYDAATDELICASCNPSGARPVATHEGDGFMFDPLILWEGRAVAAVLPEATRDGVIGPSFYRPRAIHDNGRLFFNAADSLVPSDSNGNWDVYQYEPTGLGDCGSSSGGASISLAAGGCVSLISSGTADEESAFLDASVGGNDVFFFTTAQLSVTDEDQEFDVYDARVNGVPATLTPNAECLGEACQPPARVPNDPTPASASFKGQGNEQPRKAARRRCAKGKRAVKRRGKTRCVPRKRKQKRQSAKRRAHRNRGAQQ